MDSAIVSMEQCRHCDHSIEEGARFCSSCGKRVSVANTDRGDLRGVAKEFVTGVGKEMRGLSVDALKSDAGKKIAAGAAMGAAASVIIPFVGPLLGATVGAGLVAYSKLFK